MKEAAARIKINKLLEEAGWRFFADSTGPANIQLEPSVTLTKQALDGLGENFEKSKKGFIDFLLLDGKGFPLVVLEAKSEDKNPLVGKEQARKYAKAQNCRFVILSNGNLHYFWDLERGNPYHITSFPSPDSVAGYKQTAPNPQQLIEEQVGADYIALTQRPNYQSEAAWRNEAERPGYIQTNKLRFLRPYQLKAISKLQQAVKNGADRFLFEMATGTGKTLTAAAVIKLFLRSGNARRVLFLVDRLELEDQAKKAFTALLSADFKTVNEGLNLEPKSRHNHALLEEKKKVFELDQDGYELRKLIKLPLNGIDVQLFAESLVSIAHLVYRNEARGVQEHVVRNALQRTFKARHLTPKENTWLPGKVADRVPVDFLFEGKQSLAMKTIDVHGRVRDQMEQWGWRWTDLHNGNPDVLRAMVYNPDQQEWDNTSLKIGREVCDLFCPYYETDQISDTLSKLSAA